MNVTLLEVFGQVALALCGLGVYGVASFSGACTKARTGYPHSARRQPNRRDCLDVATRVVARGGRRVGRSPCGLVGRTDIVRDSVRNEPTRWIHVRWRCGWLP